MDPNDTDKLVVQVPLDASGLDVDEWSRFRNACLNKYNKFRFDGCSVTLQRTADKTLVCTNNATTYDTLSIVNQRAARMRTIVDSYQKTGFTDVIANDTGMENAANVKSIGYRPVKICKFKVPQNIKNVLWKASNMSTFPAAMPAYVLGNIPELMEYFYPGSFAVPTEAVNSTNIPTNALIQVDTFPRTVVPPPLAANTVRALTGISFTMFKNFYYECSGLDVSGAVS